MTFRAHSQAHVGPKGTKQKLPLWPTIQNCYPDTYFQCYRERIKPAQQNYRFHLYINGTNTNEEQIKLSSQDVSLSLDSWYSPEMDSPFMEGLLSPPQLLLSDSPNPGSLLTEMKHFPCSVRNSHFPAQRPLKTQDSSGETMRVQTDWQFKIHVPIHSL